MASVAPFRALRYSAEAGPLDELVAPPYDVIDDEARRAFLARSPFNVVHLTLPDSPERASQLLTEWRAAGILQDEEPALWWLAQDFVGPDGVERTREGIAGSVEVTPYSAGQILPHELTHAGPKEGRLRLVRATRTQLEPIFLIYDAEAPFSRPGGEPDLEVDEGGVRTRLWRLGGEALDVPGPLLIADGHHRYETAVAFREEEPTATHTFAVLVSSRSPGVEIFPTHRLVQHVGIEPVAAATPAWEHDALAMYRGGSYFRVDSADELDSRQVQHYEPVGVEYTPYADRAVAVVDAGEAERAFLVRPPTIEQVYGFAAAGETMPQKSTFFYPKLTSGLLFHPV